MIGILSLSTLVKPFEMYSSAFLSSSHYLWRCNETKNEATYVLYFVVEPTKSTYDIALKPFDGKLWKNPSL